MNIPAWPLQVKLIKHAKFETALTLCGPPSKEPDPLTNLRLSRNIGPIYWGK